MKYKLTIALPLSFALGCTLAQPTALPVPPQVAHDAEPPGPIRHVIVLTIDGLMPEAYLRPDVHGLKVPRLRELVARGASSSGAASVFPSLTYPAHTSIATGVTPARHGIVTNTVFDPLEKNQNAWRWYDADVLVPRVWDVALAAGYRTALIDWPVTVGEAATFHVPEFWRAKVSDDVKLIRALSTPGLLEAVSAKYPDFAAGFRPQDVADEAGTDIVLHILAEARPHLTFLHIWQVDAAQHFHGLWSERARAAIETADAQIGRLLQAVEQAGIADSTALVVASDHGFASITRCVNPNVSLRRAGLLEVDAAGHVTDWRAAVLPAHGSAYVYLADEADAALRAATTKVFDDAKRLPNSGIAHVFGHDEIVAKGGDPAAFLALEAELGTYFGTGLSEYETPPAYQATHGYDPIHPEMQAALLLLGPGIPHGELTGARLIDIAPTVAAWLGLDLANVEGKPLVVNATPRSRQ